ncbi:MAG: hypothetical protein U1C04_18920 [Hydrogenophaga sp.]|uniref:hypothetical protein n=1 Tax=Hydrogenophaga sp. TaxID=1904254 RepID=UPI002ABBC925|nr:hypothetical protein [Hydrogenophaga sp.]MDZ4282824.1 hypothetical protein [Hydrogenophaga sp.]
MANLFVGEVFIAADASVYGKYRISGTTKTIGLPLNLPVRRRVRLHRQITGRPVREVWSDAATGSYSFDNLPPDIYYVAAFDHTGLYGGVIETDVVAELMP